MVPPTDYEEWTIIDSINASPESCRNAYGHQIETLPEYRDALDLRRQLIV